MSPTFSAVTSETSCTLADLSVTGYKTPDYDEEMDETTGGCVGATFCVQFLTSSGTTKASYYWIDDGNGHKGWYLTPECDEIDGGAQSVSITAGSSLWIVGRGLSLQSAGKVPDVDIVVQTSTSGAIAIGNATPVDLTLAKLLVEGYEDPEYDEEMDETTGGCVGATFGVQFLNTNGTTKNTYYWIDDGNGHKGWYASPECDEISGGASSIEIKAGDGVWVIGRGLSLRIPAPEL